MVLKFLMIITVIIKLTKKKNVFDEVEIFETQKLSNIGSSKNVDEKNIKINDDKIICFYTDVNKKNNNINKD